MKKIRFRKKVARAFVNLCLITLLLYGTGRLYFQVTDGFAIGNITSDFIPAPERETRPLTKNELQKIDEILSQDFYYLGKGCQSYVFKSDDEEYVIKFFKYQRFRPQAWFNALSFVPFVENIRQKKIVKKQKKLDGFFEAWKVSFDHLQDESGVVFVHLNKTDYLNKKFSIVDKMGMKHTIDADQIEFMVQKKATMLCPTIDCLMRENKQQEAKQLLTDLITMVGSEYARGFADNDHALMQNTGVYHGKPIHVDVGQFVKDEQMKDMDIARQEIFNKTYKFRIWLQHEHPELLDHTNQELTTLLGEQFSQMSHKPKPKL